MARLERRHRNKEIRKRKSFVVIACEGKNRTETIYFNNYASRKCIIKFATGIHTNPLGMAKDLVKYMKNEDIRDNFKEFNFYRHDCEYKDCMHLSELNCRVKDELSKGNILKSRYDNYINFIKR